MHSQPIEILLVDDDQADVRMTQRLLAKAKVHNRVQVARDGVEALDRLRGTEADPANRFDLILLDLNMPRMDGHELLEIVKADAKLARIPVVVMTTSDADADVVRSYDLHANAYVTKPIGLQEFARVVQAIEGFWFEIVRLPVDERPAT